MPQSLQEVLSHLSELPAFPKVTARLLRLLGDPRVSVDGLAEVISTDPSLAFKVVRLANSPFYMISRPISSVKDAVFVLGITAVKSITAAASIHRGFAAYEPRPDVADIRQFWQHSYATAIVARTLAGKCCPDRQEPIYLAGLIHDIGKLIIAYYWPETWKLISERFRACPEESLEDQEMRYFGSTHAEVGRQLCCSWELPDDITALVADGPTAGGDDGCLETGRAILREADAYAKQSGYGFPKRTETRVYSEATRAQIDSLDLTEAVEYQLYVLDQE
jgi:HD-like signal output (HDOD) protein